MSKAISRKIFRRAENFLSAMEAPGPFWFKLRNQRMVAFRMCKSLRQFSLTKDGSHLRQIIDVGANIGQFAKMARFCWPEAFIDSFEPDPAAVSEFTREHGADKRIKLHEYALGSKPGMLVIHYGETSEQNSALIEKHAGSKGSFEVKVLRLDDVRLNNYGGCRLVKIDVQGYEQHVLNGAEATLETAHFLLIELSLADLFVGGALLEEVWMWLRKHGFKYSDVLDCFRDSSTGSILQMDVLFRNGL